MQRRITYGLGTEAVTPDGDLVRITAVGEVASWETPNQGIVEPSSGYRFVRLFIEYTPVEVGDDLGEIADAFGLELDSGEEVRPLREWYNADELQGRFGDVAPADERVSGQVWFEVPLSASITYATFRCGPLLKETETQEGMEIIYRWPTGGADPSKLDRSIAGGHGSSTSSMGAPPSSAPPGENGLGEIERPEGLQRVPPAFVASGPAMLLWGASTASNPPRYYGSRYTLGLTKANEQSIYVIADSSGTSVETFAFASDGWTVAWQAFKGLEPAGVFYAAPLAWAGHAPPHPMPDAPTSGSRVSGATSAPASNAPATASLVFGVLSIAFWSVLPVLPGVLAIAFGGVGISNANNKLAPSKGLAIAGLVCGIISILGYMGYVGSRTT